MTKKCFFCSYPNKDSAKTCINCGNRLYKYWMYIDNEIHLIDERLNDD